MLHAVPLPSYNLSKATATTTATTKAETRMSSNLPSPRIGPTTLGHPPRHHLASPHLPVVI